MNSSTAAAPTVTLPKPEPTTSRKRLITGLTWWEIGVLLLSLALIVFVAVPNYFNALETLRGKDCSARLTLVANCLKFLAAKNGTKPGEKICELFDLNETLELAQGGSMLNENTESVPFMYRVGSEPDCPGTGDHKIDLTLRADGTIEPPICTRSLDPKSGAYFKANGLHVCDMTKVNGDITYRPPVKKP